MNRNNRQNITQKSFFILFLVLVFTITAGATKSYAAEEPLERSATNPTAWKWYYNVSKTTILNQIKKGYRIMDIEVVRTSSYRFNVAMVKNSDVHASSWWWYYGINSTQLSSYIRSNKARLIDLESYYINGRRYFAVVMIKNTGTRKSGWYYYYGQTLTGLSSKLRSKKARLIDVDTYVRNGVRYYDAIMLPNSGHHAKSWWWYTNITSSQIKFYLRSKKARLIDIERQSNGRYTVVMIKNNGKQWWWHYGVTSTTVKNFVSQYGTRIIDIESYIVNGKRRFNVIYLNNVNQQTSRLRDYLNARSTGGNYGVYVKRVAGGTSAALKSTSVFEPASTIKALHHIHGMKRVYNGWDSLNDWIFGYRDYILKSDGTNTSCPKDSTLIWARRKDAHSMMMNDSDNRWTQALRVHFGEAQINNTAYNLGMYQTSINHRIGCGSDIVANPNRLTLSDAGKLYESVRSGYIGYGATRNKFYDLMETGKFNITTIIDQEAASLNVSASKVMDFKSRVKAAAKAGNYTLNSQLYLSIAGWVSLPAKYSSGKKYNREYVHGAYIEKASWISSALNIWSFRGESLREQIRSALITYKYY